MYPLKNIIYILTSEGKTVQAGHIEASKAHQQSKGPMYLLVLMVQAPTVPAALSSRCVLFAAIWVPAACCVEIPAALKL